MIEQGWRKLYELADYGLVFKVNEGKISMKETIEYAYDIVNEFQNILKRCYDLRDEANFCRIVKKVKDLFKFVDYYEEGIPQSDEKSELVGVKNEMLFGLGSWIFALSPENYELAKKYVYPINEVLPRDIFALISLYSKVISDDAEKTWDWDKWEWSLHEEGEVIWFNFSGKINDFMLFLLLARADKFSEHQINSFDYYDVSSVAQSIKGEGGLLSRVEAAKVAGSKWEEMISNKSIKNFDKVEILLNNTSDQYESVIQAKIRKSSIDKAKVDNFIKGINKNIRVQSGIKNIYKFFNKYHESKKTLQVESYFGINTLFDKSPFLADEVQPDVAYIGIDDGFHIGEGITRGENNIALCKIIELLPEKPLDNYVTYIINSIAKELLVISINHGDFGIIDINDDQLKYYAKWRSDFKSISSLHYPEELLGVYKRDNIEVPVFELYADSIRPQIIVLEVQSLGSWNQYLFGNNNSTNGDNGDDFIIEVTEIIEDSDDGKSILSSPPEWLSEKEDIQGSKEYLREKVIIRIKEDFDLTLDKAIEGAIFLLKDTEDDVNEQIT